MLQQQQNPGFRKNLRKSVYQALRTIDSFSKPINFTYRGQDSYRTAFGGFVTFSIGVLLAVMFFYKAISIADDPQNIGEKGINFAFMISDTDGNPIDYQNQVGNFVLSQQMLELIKYPNGTQQREWTYQEIPYSLCTMESQALSMLEKSDLEQYPIEFYYCPDFTNLTLQGNFHSPQYQYLYLEFKKCTNKSLCLNQTLLTQRIERSLIQLIVISSFFDVENYEKPVKYFMDDAFFPLIDQQNIQGLVNIRLNELEMHDSVSGFWEDEENEIFYQMSTLSTMTQSLKTTSGSLFTLQVQLDKYVDRFSRQVYTINDMLQELGGIQAVLFFIGFLIYNNFEESKFYLSMARNLFLIQDYTKMIDPADKEDSDDLDTQNKKLSSEKETKKFIESQKRKKTIMKKKKKLKDSLKNVLVEQTSGDREQIFSQIYKYIKNRRNLNFFYKDIFRTVFEDLFGKCSCCKKKKQDQHQLSKAKRKLLVNKGKDRFIEEMDCVNIVRKLRMVENLAQLLLSIPQQILLYNQKKDVIHVDQSSDDDDIVQNLQNVRSRMQRNIKLFSAFAYYKRKKDLTEIDKRIIMGTVSNNPHFFNKDELEKKISNKIKLMNQLSIQRKDLKKVEDLYETLDQDIKNFQKLKYQTFHQNQNSKYSKSKQNTFINRNIGFGEHAKDQIMEYQNCFEHNQESSRQLHSQTYQHKPKVKFDTRRRIKSDVISNDTLTIDFNDSPSLKDKTQIQEINNSFLKDLIATNNGQSLEKLQSKSLIIQNYQKKTGLTNDPSLLEKSESQESIFEGDKAMKINALSFMKPQHQ
eukprot:403370182